MVFRAKNAKVGVGNQFCFACLSEFPTFLNFLKSVLIEKRMKFLGIPVSVLGKTFSYFYTAARFTKKPMDRNSGFVIFTEK